MAFARAVLLDWFILCDCYFQAETLALALLSCAVQEKDLLGNVEIFTCLVEVQGYCQVGFVL